MARVALARPDLFSLTQAGKIVGFDRQTVAEIAPPLGVEWKADPCRPNAKMVDRSDIERIAEPFGITIDWDALLSA